MLDQPTTDPIAQIKGLRVEFQTKDGPVVGVENVSFDIHSGETVCVVGESGSGKSVSSLSLMRLVEFGGGKIAGGDWASSVPAWCDIDCRMGVLPGQDLAQARAEIEACVAGAARDHPFLSNSPPEVIWNGFQAEGYVLGPEADPALCVMRAAFAEVFGPDRPLEEHKMTALTDTRFYGLYYDIPAFCIGPRAENIHGFDERVNLASCRDLTILFALFIARWCGLNPSKS